MTSPDPRELRAQGLDAQDPLAAFRERFVIDDPELIYLDGNSLGRLPRASRALADKLIEEQWGARLIRGWEEGWMFSPERIGAKIAALIGAQPDEVILADATSINLFKLVVAALRYQPGRSTLLTDNLNFPSDLYVLESAIKLLDAGHQLKVLPSPDGIHGPVDEIQAQLDERVALLTLSHTTFKSSYTYDLAALTAAAHAAGALVLWDLSHSAGAVPIELNAADVDLAVGCTYKYLCGGPGAPAFLYVRRDLQERLESPLQGWMGRADMFAFDLQYAAHAGIRRFLTGTPAVLSLAMIEPGVDLLLEAGIDALRAKSIAQTEFLIEAWEGSLRDLGFALHSPREPAWRGSHISLGHPKALGIDQALIHAMKVIPDFRAPDNIRLGIAPLYTRFSDLHETLSRLEKIIRDDLHAEYRQTTPTVT